MSKLKPAVQSPPRGQTAAADKPSLMLGGGGGGGEGESSRADKLAM